MEKTDDPEEDGFIHLNMLPSGDIAELGEITHSPNTPSLLNSKIENLNATENLRDETSLKIQKVQMSETSAKNKDPGYSLYQR